MSRRHKIKHMTSEELKSKLYAHFQKTGSLDHLRTQLRGQLVSELFKVAEPLDVDKFPSASDVDKCLLPLQVCNWLVHDHLSRQDYQYSLSTFVTEAQLPYPEKFLTAGDILRILGLSHNTPEFESISKFYTEKNELDYLNSLLLAILKTLFNFSDKFSTLNQTQESGMDISFKQKSSHEQGNLNQSFDGNKVYVQDTLLTGDNLKSKDFNPNKSFLSDFEGKTAEFSFQEQLQSVKKESEREVQKLRHKLLEELESLHSQERKMHLELEYTKSELKREQNKLIKEKEMLKEQGILWEKELNNKFEIKMRDAESDFAAKLHIKDKEIETLKAKLTENNQKLTRVEIELSSEKENCNLLRQELEDMKHMYKIVQDKYSSVLDENTNLLKKFENMSDYTILKEELSAKSNEVMRLQNDIRDIHQRSEGERRKFVETVRNLEENLSMKEPQLNQAKIELDKVQNTLTTEKSMWNKERRKLELELNEFKDLYKTVIQRMEEQQDDIQDLQKTIQILNYKLINNAINITKSDSSGASKSFQAKIQTSTRNKPETLFTKRNIHLQHQPSEIHDSSLKFLSDAKNRFGKLKQEEDSVQEKYSYIFTSLPDFDKNPQSYLESLNVTKPKISTKDYSFTPFLKSVNFDTNLSDNYASKNRISQFRSPYSLNEVKRMVSDSLLSYTNENQTDFRTNFGNLGFSTVRPNENQYSYAAFNQSNSGSNTIAPSNLRNEHVGEQFLLNTKEANLGHTTELSSEQDNQEKETITKQKDFPPFPQEKKSANSTKNNQSQKLDPSQSSADKITSFSRTEPVSRLQDSISENKATTPKNNEPVLSQTSQELPSVSLENSGRDPEPSSSLFVNLDAAWKQRSVIPRSPFTLHSFTEKSINEASTKDNSTLESNTLPAVVEKKKLPDSELPQTEKSKNSKPVGQILTSSAIEESTESTRVGASVIYAGDGKSTEFGDSVIHKSDLGLPKHSSNDKISNLDKETLKNVEQDKEKSSDKIASADSLSELSEVHLSCGSETEQQKEDSDAW